MLAINFRRLIWLNLLLLALLALVYLLGTTWLVKTVRRRRVVYTKPYRFEKSKFQLQQNGKYWIINDYLQARGLYKDNNNSITLATHGTYVDFQHLEWLLARWGAPISLTLFTSGDDFEQTLISLYHMKYCSRSRPVLLNLVSIHLVFHNAHFPTNLQRMSTSKLPGLRCNYTAPYVAARQSATYWHRHGLKYPANLLRNVARLNAQTFYVLTMDADLLPSIRFVQRFMPFLQNYEPRRPLKSVYCLPVFPQLPDWQLPLYKSQLVEQFVDHLEAHKNETLPADIKHRHHWLATHISDGDMRVFALKRRPVLCAAYVSINTLEPLYDERLAESMHDSSSTRLATLAALHYDFIIMDGTFLIKRLNDTWARVRTGQQMAPTAKNLIVQQLRELNALTLWYSQSNNNNN